MKKISKTLLTVIITAIVTFFLTTVVLFSEIKPFLKLLRVSSIIDTFYIDKYDKVKAQDEAIEAFVNTIGDKYASYYDEKSADEIMKAYEGTYRGIGVEVYKNPEADKIVISNVFEGSSAYLAGIKPGDIIVSIDATEYTGEQINDAIEYIKNTANGEKKIEIAVLRDNKVLNFCVKNGKVNMYEVSSRFIDDICYIRYAGFSETSHIEAEKIIKSLNENIKGIVIDIRNNPGGSLESVIGLSDLFLDNEMIMYTLDKNGNKKVYKATKGKCDLPLAVLVNSHSASASEVFAGAIQSNDRGVIVGEKTYGKGVTQAIIYMDGKSTKKGALKLTVTKNFTPDGRWMNESIIPDIEAKEPICENIENDEAFLKAVTSLKKGK